MNVAKKEQYYINALFLNPSDFVEILFFYFDRLENIVNCCFVVLYFYFCYSMYVCFKKMQLKFDI